VPVPEWVKAAPAKITLPEQVLLIVIGPVPYTGLACLSYESARRTFPYGNAIFAAYSGGPVPPGVNSTYGNGSVTLYLWEDLPAPYQASKSTLNNGGMDSPPAAPGRCTPARTRSAATFPPPARRRD